MRYGMILGCVVLLAVAARGEEKASRVEGAKFLQGEWTVVGIEGGGIRAAPEELRGMKWSIRGDLISASQPGGSGRMRYRIDSEKTPKEFDLTSLDEGPLKGKTDPGIYEFKDGQLRICYRDPDNRTGKRPRDFSEAAPVGSGYGIIVLEKVK